MRIEKVRKKLSFLPINLALPSGIIINYMVVDNYIEMNIITGVPALMNRIFRKKMIKNLEKFLKSRGIRKVKVEVAKVE